MEQQFILKEIGNVFCDNSGFGIKIKSQYRRGLAALEGFSHVLVLWWASQCDSERDRAILAESKPYKKGPETVGIFATRSPGRPNPIGVSAAQVTFIDLENGLVGLTWADAYHGTPVLDIKPYTPSVDRVEAPISPEWCAHWPQSVETSGDFDWEQEFNF